jgi:hypothetical protein
MGKPGPKATNIFQKLKLGNNSVKSMPKYETSPVKKALIGDQHKLPEELKAKIKAAPGKKHYGKSHSKKLKSPSVAKQQKLGQYAKPSSAKKHYGAAKPSSAKKHYGKPSMAKKFKSDAQRKAAYASGYKGK